MGYQGVVAHEVCDLAHYLPYWWRFSNHGIGYTRQPFNERRDANASVHQALVAVHDLAVFEDNGRYFCRTVTLRGGQTSGFKVDYSYYVQSLLPERSFCAMCGRHFPFKSNRRPDIEQL